MLSTSYTFLFLFFSIVSSNLDIKSFYVELDSMSSPMTQGGAPYTYTFPMYATFPSHPNVAMALAGYRFSTLNTIDFQTFFDDIGAVNFIISIHPWQDMQIYRLGFFILMVNPSSDWVWMLNGTTTTSSLYNYNSGGLAQVFYADDAPISLANFPQMLYYVVLQGYYVQSLPGTMVKVKLSFNHQNSTNKIYLKAERGSVATQAIRWVMYTVIIYNFTNFLNKRIPSYAPTPTLYTNFDGNNHLIGDQVATNFGIPDFFLNQNLGGYQEHCWIGINRIELGGSLPTPQVRGMMYDPRQHPMLLVDNQLPIITLGNGTSYVQQFHSDYLVICARECPVQNFQFTADRSCIDCSSNTSGYYINILQTCVRCNQSMEYCLTCSVDVALNEYNCTSCQPPFIPHNSICQNCTSILKDCSQCNNSSYCITCASSTLGFSSNTNQCVPCSQLFQRCSRCNNYECLFCSDGFVLSAGICECQIGILVSNLCTTVTGCVEQVDNGNGNGQCSQCNTTYFESTPVNGLCVCKNGYNLVNNVCNSILGCISPQMLQSGQINCLYCNQSAKYQADPDANGNCACKNKYELKNKECVDICGDGYVMDSSPLACDDGNLIDGDGCSSLCQVQAEYSCSGGSSSPSSCTYQGIPLTIELKSMRRMQGLNQGVFKFTVTPSLLVLNNMDFHNYVSFICNSTYSVSDVSYSSGQLTLTADYTEDMEDRTCNLTLSFDASLVQSQPQTSIFIVQSSNIALLYYSRIDQYQRIKFIFQVLSYIALCLFALSLPTKVIGVQLLTCCQLVFISYCFYEKPSLLYSAIHSLNLVSGYWSLFKQSDYSYLPGFTDRLQLGPYFLENNFLVIITLLFFSVLAGLLIIFSCCQKKQQIHESNSLIQVSSLPSPNKIAKGIYRWFIFPLTIGFLLIFFLSSYIGNLRIVGDTMIFAEIFQSASMIFVWLLLGLVFCIQIFISGQKQMALDFKKWYIPALIVKLLVIATLIEIALYFQRITQVAYILGLLQLGNINFIIIFRPYSSIFHNLGLIFCQFTVLYSCMLPSINNFSAFSEQIAVLLLFLMEGMLILLFLFSLIRILLAYCSILKYICQNKGEQTVVEAKIIKTQEQSRSQKREGEQSKYLSFLQKQSVARKQKIPFPNPQQIDQYKRAEEEDHQLRKMKQKLRQKLLLARKKNAYQLHEQIS